MGGYFHALSPLVDGQLQKLRQIKQSETAIMRWPRKPDDIQHSYPPALVSY